MTSGKCTIGGAYNNVDKWPRIKFDALNRWRYVVKFDVFEVNHNHIQVMLWYLTFLLILAFFHVMTMFFTTLFSSRPLRIISLK
jgi:hypothetical protein